MSTPTAEDRARAVVTRSDEFGAIERDMGYTYQEPIAVTALRDLLAERQTVTDEMVDYRIAADTTNVLHQFHGEQCLCGFSSARSRSRTEHITAAALEAALLHRPEGREAGEWQPDPATLRWYAETVMSNSTHRSRLLLAADQMEAGR